LRAGDVEAREQIYWGDPGVFDVLPLPVFAGNLEAALRRPDGIVLTRSVARKYFGRDAVLGATIQLDNAHVQTVTAVIEDLPVHGTELETGIFASGLASYSRLALLDNTPSDGSKGTAFGINVRTYFRLAPGASIDSLQNAMPALMDSLWPRRPPGLGASVKLMRIDATHLFPGLNPGKQGRVALLVLVGLLILFIASGNFVNLSTARSARRAVESAYARWPVPAAALSWCSSSANP